MTNSSPTFSVVIPHFNSPQSLERAVRSALQQTYPAHEIIVVDDGSKPEIREKYLQWLTPLLERDQVLLIELETNAGPSFARNSGWDIATGDFISFLDADDSWHPDKLQRVAKVLSANPRINLLAHRWVLFNKLNSAAPVARGQLSKISQKHWLRGNPASTPTVTLRRDLPLRFDSTQRYAEDYRLWLWIFYVCGETYMLDEPLTFLHKAAFGESGLSSALWAMEKGELRTLYSLVAAKHLSVFRGLATMAWSGAKFARRLVASRLGRMG